MEEALEILWTYARRQPIESNGKTVVASISQSIAAIRIIMRLERWLQKSKERKVKSSENLELGYVGRKLPCMEPARPTPAHSGKVCENKVCEPFTQHADASLQLVPTSDRACSSSHWCGLISWQLLPIPLNLYPSPIMRYSPILLPAKRLSPVSLIA